MTITTVYTTTASGAGRIVAKGKGKQRTMPYAHENSAERNHGNAAGDLALVLGLPWSDDIVHMGYANQTHKFVFP